jgi:hypothetical protein
MRETNVFFHWKSPAVCRRYRTGVSLHSHTLHSHESLDFLTKICDRLPYVCRAVREYKDAYFARNGRHIDLSRGYWTPPLCARQAWNVEKSQLEDILGLDALVSLSDHDNIEASSKLRVADTSSDIPVSVEWTVPYRGTFFHLGIHNLPKFDAPAWMTAMREFTRQPKEDVLSGIMDALSALPGTLIVFNHPMWDEKGVGGALHWSLVTAFLKRHGSFVHALELNGLRPWKENQQNASLAKAYGLPVISGGDRHAREPNTCVNLTNAATFAEFVEEVRRDRWSDVLFLPQYRENFKLRIIQNMCEVLRADPDHSLGWRRWSDRIFYVCDDGERRSLGELWGQKTPGIVNHFVGLMRLVEEGWLRSALRIALPQREEPAI